MDKKKKHERHYEQEAIGQERKANQRILAGFRYFLLGMIVIWILTMLSIFIIDKTITTIATAVMVPLLSLPLTVSKKTELSSPWLKYFFLTIVCIASGVIAAILTYHAVFLYIMPLLFAVQCRQRKVLWITYGVNTVCMLLSCLAGFYYGLCDLNLLLDSSHTRSWYQGLIVNHTVTLPLNENMLFIIVFFEVFPRAMILLIFALMLQYTVIRSGEDAVRIAELTWRKETDINTGLYNKNKYEEMADEYYPRILRVSAIYWDLNNLKQTNDKYGHAVGDALIGTLSKCLLAKSSDRCRSYRMGGDEFVMIIDDPERAETERTIKEVWESLKKCHEEGDPMVSSAVGWFAGEGKDIRNIVNRADSNMYADKVGGKEGRGR